MKIFKVIYRSEWLYSHSKVVGSLPNDRKLTKGDKYTYDPATHLKLSCMHATGIKTTCLAIFVVS